MVQSFTMLISLCPIFSITDQKFLFCLFYNYLLLQANAVYSLALGSSTPTIVYNGLVTDPMGIEAITPDRQEMGES